MKNIIKNIAAAVAAIGLVVGVAALLSQPTVTKGADVISPRAAIGQPIRVLTSVGAWGTNQDRGTNGLFPCSIAHDKTITGYIPIPMVPGADSLAIQFSATAGDTTNVELVLRASCYPPSLGMSAASGSAGMYTNANPDQTFDTITLAVGTSGVTVTNKVYSSTTKGALPYIYIYSIKSGVGTVSWISNYTVWACSQ